MDECSGLLNFPAAYDICTGNTSIEKWRVNVYRERWGLSALYPEEMQQEYDASAITIGSGPPSASGALPTGVPMMPPPRAFGSTGMSIAASPLEHMVAGNYDLLMPGPGTQLLKMYSDVPACSACFNLALEMNDWGPDGCEENLDYIVQDILPRALKWIADSKPWIHKLLPNIVEQEAAKIKIRSDVKKAIQLARDELASYKQPNVIASMGQPRVRKKGGGCGCG